MHVKELKIKNMSKYRFYKNEAGWFIDLKWWPFGKHHLAMVLGADVLLEELSEGKNEVKLKLSTRYFDSFHSVLTKKNYGLKFFEGAVYEGGTSSAIKYTLYEYNQLWLCPVTLFVFLRYPNKIFYEVIR